MTAGYRSRVTGGAGRVSLRAAGEHHTHVRLELIRVVVPDTVREVIQCLNVCF